ncbi:MAG: META domain-containing protein [Candidatus Contendobacter sp.]|jgi:heat shock protein HslJ|nr:META domain-containing protein [Candidatus Contendobacter sp.]
MVNLHGWGILMVWALPVLALAGEVDRTALEGALWRLVSVARTDGQLHAVPNSVETTATFANGSVSGSGGCNRYTASYTVDDGKLTIGKAASTMMACPKPQTAIEQPFMAALAATMAYKIEDGQLSLLDAGGQKIATFKVWQPVALKGVTWRATLYNNGRGAAVSLIDGSKITAIFGTDGVLSGSAGCNHYRAAYVTEGSSITIQAPAATRRTCSRPDGVMRQESEYLNALTTAATYAIQGRQLELRTTGDALVALFRASGG